MTANKKIAITFIVLSITLLMLIMSLVVVLVMSDRDYLSSMHTIFTPGYVVKYYVGNVNNGSSFGDKTTDNYYLDFTPTVGEVINLQEPEIPQADDMLFMGWYMDEEYTVPAVFPITPVQNEYDEYEEVRLYAQYKEGNVPETNYTYNSVGGYYYINATSLGSDFTSDTLVIPDYHNAAPVYYANSILYNNTTVKKLYIGREVDRLNGSFAEKSAITSIYWGYKPKCTAINYYAFRNCTSLDGSLVLPDSIKTIGNRSFYGCTNIDSITLNNGLQSVADLAFAQCSSVSNELLIPSTLTTIANSAFAYTNIGPSLTVPATVTTLGGHAFNGCTALSSVIINGGTVEENSVTISSGAFRGCSALTNVTINENITNIGENAFDGCYRLNSISTPSSVTTIGKSAFANCTNLNEVELGDGVQNIDESAFTYTAVNNLVIPGNVTNIGKYAFAYCDYLESVTIKEGVLTIDESAFRDCVGLNGTLTIPASMKEIKKSAFYGCNGIDALEIKEENNSALIIGDQAFAQCTELGKDGSITFPSSVSSVGDSAFYNCPIKEITICGDTSIGSHCFMGNSALVSIKSSDLSQTSYNSEISTYAFHSCTGLTSVKINAGKIHSNAFYNCSALTTAILNVNEIDSNAFYISSISDLQLGASLNKIGHSSFYASKLSSVNIPSSVTEITGNPFIECSNLQSITIDSNNANYFSCDSENNYNAIISKSGKLVAGCINSKIPQGTIAGLLENGITEIGASAFSGQRGNTGEIVTNGITIPSTVTYIGPRAFYDCRYVSKIVLNNCQLFAIEDYTFYNCLTVSSFSIPSTVQRIGARAFYNCSSWTGDIKLPSAVVTIGEYAFYNCRKISSIDIPDAVTDIEKNTFENCVALKYIWCRGVEKIKENAFKNANSDIVLNVQSGNWNVVGKDSEGISVTTKQPLAANGYLIVSKYSNCVWEYIKE